MGKPAEKKGQVSEVMEEEHHEYEEFVVQKNVGTVRTNYEHGQSKNVYGNRDELIEDESKDTSDGTGTQDSDTLTDFDDLEISYDRDDLFYKDAENNAAMRRSATESLNQIYTIVTNPVVDEEFEINSDDLLTGSDSSNSDSEGGDQVRGPYFNEQNGFKKEFEMVLGMQFSSPKIFRKALQYYAIRKGFDYDFINNKRKRVNVQCRNRDCPWRITASWHKYRAGGAMFQIKTLIEHQNCPRDIDNKKVSARFLAEYYRDEIKDNPSWTVEAFRRHVRRDLRVNVSYAHCHRAKKFAKEFLDGKLGEQYSILRDYCDALKLYNPGTSIHLSLDNGRFKRIYICPDACKRGFVIGCRPIISLDACHLKGSYTGQIHSAVGRDGNDNMFPIAYAICEAETKDTWVWFIERLLADIGEGLDHGWTFISDQQKGLGEALKNLAPRSEHRLCVRHLYANFAKTFKGKELKDAMWACARATTYNTHMMAMNQLKMIDKEAFMYLEKLDKAVWCRHAFSYYALSDSLCSNISECFNAFIKDARSEPIITCLETIRCLLMKRFMEKFRGMQKHQGDLCPRIWRKLEANRQVAMDCEVQTGGSDKFQVKSTYWGMYVTDLAARSCECRLWDLTGIPCVHACAAITYLGGSPNAYVHQSYSKGVFLKTYQFIVEPISGPVEWPHSFEEPVLPPMYRKQSGRPKKTRKRGLTEQKKIGAQSRVGGKIHCGRCDGEGHNQRNCQKDPVDTKKAKFAKKLAENTKRYRERKKLHGATDKKAKTRRKEKEVGQTMTRPSHVSSIQITREWQRPYVDFGNAIPYSQPSQQGPILLRSQEGSIAMFTKRSEPSSSSQPPISNRPRPSQSSSSSRPSA